MYYIFVRIKNRDLGRNGEKRKAQAHKCKAACEQQEYKIQTKQLFQNNYITYMTIWFSLTNKHTYGMCWNKTTKKKIYI